MGYQWSWLLPHRVAAIDLWGNLTHEEIEFANRELSMQLDRAKQSIHVVVDVSRLSTHPLKISSIRKHCASLSHPRIGWMTIYGVRGHIIPIMLSVMAEITPFRYQIVNSAAEAMRFLSAQDPTLTKKLAKVGLATVRR